MLTAALVALLPSLVLANPLGRRWTASPYAGSTAADVFPPTGSKLVNSHSKMLLTIMVLLCQLLPILPNFRQNQS